MQQKKANRMIGGRRKEIEKIAGNILMSCKSTMHALFQFCVFCFEPFISKGKNTDFPSPRSPKDLDADDETRKEK